MYGYLDLNKDKIKKSVVSKLNAIGYEVNEGTSVRCIQEIIKTIQKDNRLMIDGCIGVNTMFVLGYSLKEINKMLKIRKHIDGLSYDYPIWLLWI